MVGLVEEYRTHLTRHHQKRLEEIRPDLRVARKTAEAAALASGSISAPVLPRASSASAASSPNRKALDSLNSLPLHPFKQPDGVFNPNFTGHQKPGQYGLGNVKGPWTQPGKWVAPPMAETSSPDDWAQMIKTRHGKFPGAPRECMMPMPIRTKYV